MSEDDSDVIGCYFDLWKTKRERQAQVYQGIGDTDNLLQLRVLAGDSDSTQAEEKTIADAYRNRFCIPLDFELLESHMPFFQAALGDRLEYELTFNDISRV